jgi:hypothetical protein
MDSADVDADLVVPDDGGHTKNAELRDSEERTATDARESFMFQNSTGYYHSQLYVDRRCVVNLIQITDQGWDDGQRPILESASGSLSGGRFQGIFLVPSPELFMTARLLVAVNHVHHTLHNINTSYEVVVFRS